MINIEIVEFYPLTRSDKKEMLTGTLRVKLPDIGIHILGIYVSKRKDFWFFSMPSRECVCHKTGERVRYPFMVFDDKEKQSELMAAIRKQGREFIESKLTESEDSILTRNQQKLCKEA